MARSSPVHSGYTILNGAGTGPNGDRIDVWVEYKVTAQSVENNTSTISAYFYTALRPGKTSDTKRSNGLYSSFKVNGVSGKNLANNAPYDFSKTTPMLLGQYSGNISHDSEGYGQAAFVGSFETQSSWITGGTIDIGAVLPKIDRGIMRVKVSGTWRTGIVYVKVSGTWRQGQVFTKVSGTWRRGI